MTTSVTSSEMPTKNKKFLRDYHRGMIRATFQSLIWAVISDRKKRGKYTMLMLADAVGEHKSRVSKFFREPANYSIDRLADYLDALGLDLHVEAVDRVTRKRFGPAGEVRPTSYSTDVINIFRQDDKVLVSTSTSFENQSVEIGV